MKWIRLEDEKPRCCDDILFYNGKSIFKGWLETYGFGEELCFVCEGHLPWVDDVTHWMPIPKPPEEKDGMD